MKRSKAASTKAVETRVFGFTSSAKSIAIGIAGAALWLAAGAAFAQSAFRLDRVSIDSAGGGVAENANYALLVSFGQHDAGEVSNSATYAYAGGVFAQVPVDRLFGDSFEGD